LARGKGKGGKVKQKKGGSWPRSRAGGVTPHCCLQLAGHGHATHVLPPHVAAGGEGENGSGFPGYAAGWF
jgi:hypothetical protein